MMIRISVQYQDGCSVAGRGIYYSEGYRYYILVHDTIRLSDLDPTGKLFYEKLEEENGGSGNKKYS